MKKSTDINNMSPEEVDNLSIKIGEKIKEVLERALGECNTLLNIYELEIEFGYEIKEKE